jgi:hypothetical protein
MPLKREILPEINFPRRITVRDGSRIPLDQYLSLVDDIGPVAYGKRFSDIMVGNDDTDPF